MRRSFILASVLAVSTAVLGACDPKTNEPSKPPATPAPTSTAIPVTSPTGSPVTSPTKSGSTPEVKDAKKVDDKSTGKDAKPVAVETPKAK